jgi:Arc/MetJ-type ribon-helix-helix transcriptional regulator
MLALSDGLKYNHTITDNQPYLIMGGCPMLNTTYARAQDKVRTTIDLPPSVRDRIQQAVERGAARSQNALIVQAIEQWLKTLDRSWLDAQFAGMETDESYRAMQLAIAEEFVPLDRETWQSGEANDAAG